MPKKKIKHVLAITVLVWSFSASTSYAFLTGGLSCVYDVLHGNTDCGHNDFGVAFCAPEVQEGNIAATERTLDELSQTVLSQEVTFKTKIADIKKLESPKKLTAYMNLVGIQNDIEIAEFVGARDGAIDSRYIQHLSESTKISPEKSELVLKKISAALLGQRR